MVTYDEFGGQWDHVAPPGAGAKKGTHDVWGPGTRIPALVIGRVAEALGRRPHVVRHDVDPGDHRAQLGLAPLSSRDRAVNDLSARGGAGWSPLTPAKRVCGRRGSRPLAFPS